MFDPLNDYMLFSDESDDAVTHNDLYREAGVNPTMGLLHYAVAAPYEFHDLLGEPDPALHDKHLSYRIERERRKDAFIAGLTPANGPEDLDGEALPSFAEIRALGSSADPVLVEPLPEQLECARELRERADRSLAHHREEQVRMLLAERFGAGSRTPIDPVLIERFGPGHDVPPTEQSQ